MLCVTLVDALSALPITNALSKDAFLDSPIMMDFASNVASQIALFAMKLTSATNAGLD